MSTSGRERSERGDGDGRASRARLPRSAAPPEPSSHPTPVFESPDGKTDLFRLRYHPLEGGYFLAERLDMLDPNSIFSGPENMVMFTVEETKIRE